MKKQQPISSINRREIIPPYIFVFYSPEIHLQQLMNQTIIPSNVYVKDKMMMLDVFEIKIHS
ncbi:TPA: hypothetical protein MIB94_25390 [Klebsiella pneumoniae]|nr:hypothetical protein AGE75_25485 [Klebsiella pneumoniae]KSY20452.1 hypothetical protein APU00_11615 [Klebsiella pneumoniae]KSY27100.1 hypothetical protein APU03_13030 [Klebsiella pneumoniae]KSY93501.1 hypothetical protein APU14_23475 [Klebsiella pneumoniae]OCV42311.1 hypothetical protein A8V41_10590 [Klebsiella pneumoniae]